jgi:hypothetical protein
MFATRSWSRASISGLTASHALARQYAPVQQLAPKIDFSPRNSRHVQQAADPVPLLCQGAPLAPNALSAFRQACVPDALYEKGERGIPLTLTDIVTLFQG